MGDFLTCVRCGLLLPNDSCVCDCGFAVDDPASLVALRYERRYRNLFLFANVFTGLGIGMILSSLIAPVAWGGAVEGLSGVLGACGFWSSVVSESEATKDRLRRRRQYAAVSGSVALFVVVVIVSGFRPDLLLWLVMPAAYAWRSWPRIRQFTRFLRNRE